MFNVDKVDFDIMNEINESLCNKCHDKYWEACMGIYAPTNRCIECCMKVFKKYEELLGKKSNE